MYSHAAKSHTILHWWEREKKHKSKIVEWMKPWCETERCQKPSRSIEMNEKPPVSFSQNRKINAEKTESTKILYLKLFFFLVYPPWWYMVYPLSANPTYIVHRKSTNTIHTSLFACIRSLYLHDVIGSTIQSTSMNWTTCALHTCRVPAILYQHCVPLCLCDVRVWVSVCAR